MQFLYDANMHVFLSPRKMILILQFAAVHALALKVPQLSAERPGLDYTTERIMSFCGNKLRGLHTSDVVQRSSRAAG